MVTAHSSPDLIPAGIWRWQTMAEQNLDQKLPRVRELWSSYQEKFDDAVARLSFFTYAMRSVFSFSFLI